MHSETLTLGEAASDNLAAKNSMIWVCHAQLLEAFALGATSPRRCAQCKRFTRGPAPRRNSPRRNIRGTLLGEKSF